MALNPLDAEVAELSTQLDAAQTKLATDTKRVAEWQAEVTRYTALIQSGQNWAVPYLPQAQANLTSAKKDVDTDKALVNQLQRAYDEKVRAQRNINDAAAAAIANGHDPDMAFAMAAKSQRQKDSVRKTLTYAAIALAVLVVLYLLWRYFLKK